MIYIIVTGIIIILLYFLLFILLSHGKLKIKPLMYQIIYSSMIGLPMMIFMYYHFRYDLSKYLLIFIIYLAIILTPTLGYLWYNILRKREPFFHTLLLTFGIFLFIFSIFFNPPSTFYFIFSGLVFLIPFFIHIFRYPYLDSTWLYSLTEEVAKKIQKKGKYTTKPVVVDKGINKRCIISTIGLTLYCKNNKTIGLISKKNHERLGNPNLNDYFLLLIEKIKDYKKNN